MEAPPYRSLSVVVHGFRETYPSALRKTAFLAPILDIDTPGLLKEEISALAELIEPGDKQLVLVDVTPVNRTRNFHNLSLETPEFFDDLFLRFTETNLPQTEALYFLETPEGVRYFVLTRGR